MTFGLMYGLYSRAASNQERPMMARVRYIEGISVLGPLIGIRLTNLPKHGDDQSWLISVFKRFGGSWGVRLIL